MNKFCCMGASLAARIIGTYTMSVFILMMNVLMSSYFSSKKDEDFFESCRAWAILGLNWMQLLRNTQMEKKISVAIIMTCFVIYALLFLLASVYLALGSISRRHKYAVPWMYLQMISIIDQSVALSIYTTHRRYDTIERSTWYIPICSIYLILSIYLWIVVQAARKEWFYEQQERMNYESRISDVLSIPTSSGLKTPSFLSQNLSMFESPRPPMILPK